MGRHCSRGGGGVDLETRSEAIIAHGDAGLAFHGLSGFVAFALEPTEAGLSSDV